MTDSPNQPSILSPQSHAWHWGMAILGLILFYAFAGQVYAPPQSNKLSEDQAIRHADELLGKLRPATHPNIEIKRFAQSHTLILVDSPNEAQWRFGYYLEAEHRLYQVFFSTDGSLRVFRSFVLVPPSTSETPPSLLSPEEANTLAGSLVEKMSLLPLVGKAPPEIDVITSLSGRLRRIVRWNLQEWSPKGDSVPVLEIAFEGHELQALEIKPKPDMSSDIRVVLKVISGIVLILVSFLPILILFVRGLMRREMGSRAALSISALLAIGPCVLWGLFIIIDLSSNSGGEYQTFRENPLFNNPNASPNYPLPLMGLLITIGMGLMAIILMLVFSVLLSVAEASDWETQSRILEDVIRLVRRRMLGWDRVREIYLTGLALGLWLLGLSTLLNAINAHSTDWLSLRQFSSHLAVGLFPWQSSYTCNLLWNALTTLWWMPLTCAVLQWRNKPRWSLVAVAALAAVALGLITNSSLSSSVSVAVLAAGVIGVMLRWGWFSAAFGFFVAYAAFPLLWASRHPSEFHLSFLGGVPLLLLPALCGLVRYVVPRHGRTEDYELAPPYIRDRFNRERRKEELDIRWTIHQNLIPASGLVLREASIAADYFHTPEQGRELFAFIPLGPQRLGIAIGEVSGTGMEASMLLAVTLTALKTKALGHPESAARVVERVNRFLYPRLSETEARIQLVYGIADFIQGTLTLCNAGYVPPLLLKNPALKSGETKQVMRVIPEAPPIGSDRDTIFPEQIWHLQPGDKIVLTSDWMWDLFDPQSSTVPLDQKLLEHIAEFNDLTPQEVVRSIVSQAQMMQNAQGKPPIEITALCVRF